MSDSAVSYEYEELVVAVERTVVGREATEVCVAGLCTPFLTSEDRNGIGAVTTGVSEMKNLLVVGAELEMLMLVALSSTDVEDEVYDVLVAAIDVTNCDDLSPALLTGGGYTISGQYQTLSWERPRHRARTQGELTLLGRAGSGVLDEVLVTCGVRNVEAGGVEGEERLVGGGGGGGLAAGAALAVGVGGSLSGLLLSLSLVSFPGSFPTSFPTIGLTTSLKRLLLDDERWWGGEEPSRIAASAASGGNRLPLSLTRRLVFLRLVRRPAGSGSSSLSSSLVHEGNPANLGFWGGSPRARWPAARSTSGTMSPCRAMAEDGYLVTSDVGGSGRKYRCFNT